VGARLGIALAIAAAVVVGGYFLYGAVFESGPDRVRHVARADAGTAVAPAPSPDAAPDDTPRVTVAAVSGGVEREIDGVRWEPVTAGTELDPEDVIRTGADGAVTIMVGQTEVVMDADTQIAVPAITETVGRIRLGQGRIAASVPGGDGASFGVAVEGSEAVAETAEGDFAVLSSGGGDATVASTRGVVKVTARDKTVEVGEGEQSFVRRGAAPTEPTAIPGSLFLKVQQPGRRQRDRRYKVHGSTTPGAVISVNGVRVYVDDTGEFSRVVSLREGKNKVVVRGLDASGRRETSSVDVTVDQTGPDVGGDVKWGTP
jgi:hypothetical protein